VGRGHGDEEHPRKSAQSTKHGATLRIGLAYSRLPGNCTDV
jgi:hypothetical protein